MQLTRRRSTGRPVSSLGAHRTPVACAPPCNSTCKPACVPATSGCMRANSAPLDASAQLPQGATAGPGAAGAGAAFVTLSISGEDGGRESSSSCRISIQHGHRAAAGPGPPCSISSLPLDLAPAGSAPTTTAPGEGGSADAPTGSGQLSNGSRHLQVPLLQQRRSTQSSLSSSTSSSTHDSSMHGGSSLLHALAAGGMACSHHHAPYPSFGFVSRSSYCPSSRSPTPDIESGAASAVDLTHLAEQWDPPLHETLHHRGHDKLHILASAADNVCLPDPSSGHHPAAGSSCSAGLASLFWPRGQQPGLLKLLHGYTGGPSSSSCLTSAAAHKPQHATAPHAGHFSLHRLRSAAGVLLVCLLILALVQVFGPSGRWIISAQRAEHAAAFSSFSPYGQPTRLTTSGKIIGPTKPAGAPAHGKSDVLPTTTSDVLPITISDGAAVTLPAGRLQQSQPQPPETPQPQDLGIELQLPGHVVPLTQALDSCAAGSTSRDTAAVHDNDEGVVPASLPDAGDGLAASSSMPVATGTCSLDLNSPWAGASHSLGLSTGVSHASCAAGSTPQGPAGSTSWCPSSSTTRIFLAVVSRCCDTQSQAKRAAVRDTWGSLVLQRYRQYMAMRFFLGQALPGQYEEAAVLLEPELQAHHDLVRGILIVSL